MALMLCCGWSLGADLSLEGLPDWNSTPARRGGKGLGAAFWYEPQGHETVWTASAEWGDTLRYRTAFLYDFYEMDSLYRASYFELSYSRNLLPRNPLDLWLGAAYGLSLEWTPRSSYSPGYLWTRHRLKAGASLRKDNFLFALSFTDFVEDLRWSDWDHFLRAGIHWRTSDSFYIFLELEGLTFHVGTSICWKWFSFTTSYSFPGFALAFSLDFNVKGFLFGGKHSFQNSNLDWNGLYLRI